MRAARVDANQAEIVGGLQACGMLVQSLAKMGQGVPDLLVHWPARKTLAILEVKNPKRPPSKQRLTANQRTWHALGWPVVVVKTLEEAIQAMRAGPCICDGKCLLKGET